MDLILPTIPAVITVLLNFFSPYAVALIVDPVWPARYKKLVAILTALLLTAVVLALAFFGFGVVIPAWPLLVLIAITTAQASYDLLLKQSTDRLAKTLGTGTGATL